MITMTGSVSTARRHFNGACIPDQNAASIAGFAFAIDGDGAWHPHAPH
jgi:hypothetical protein